MFDKDAIGASGGPAPRVGSTRLREFLIASGGQDGIPDVAGLPLKRVYTAEDVADLPFDAVGLPGQYPYARPVPHDVPGALWTMRQIAGFGTGEDTNRRFRYLIDQVRRGCRWTSTCRP